jgi:predicted nuclease of predicted toxin-antitoxin system
VRFKIDENLPQEVAELLCENGHDAVSVFDQTLSGKKDPTIFEVCQDEGRILVTLDLDFANIQTYPPATSAGIVVLRLAHQDKPWVLEVVEKLIPALATKSVFHQLWIVEEDRIRIRGLPA